ncbi:hypothetical protein ElyMa_006026900 [Elysia marginata]|uniref:Uncharacterized protein n=1 Tax=Elysia marginata TaxID=1093978 RepID=A0AAV4GK86_9GAST|nr:hypothetical protein ElyMa_006026900 [Elysia marginata]
MLTTILAGGKSQILGILAISRHYKRLADPSICHRTFPTKPNKKTLVNTKIGLNVLDPVCLARPRGQILMPPVGRNCPLVKVQSSTHAQLLQLMLLTFELCATWIPCGHQRYKRLIHKKQAHFNTSIKCSARN